jgi:hypothetical protein
MEEAEHPHQQQTQRRGEEVARGKVAGKRQRTQRRRKGSTRPTAKSSLTPGLGQPTRRREKDTRARRLLTRVKAKKEMRRAKARTKAKGRRKAKAKKEKRRAKARAKAKEECLEAKERTPTIPGLGTTLTCTMPGTTGDGTRRFRQELQERQRQPLPEPVKVQRTRGLNSLGA